MQKQLKKVKENIIQQCGNTEIKLIDAKSDLKKSINKLKEKINLEKKKISVCNYSHHGIFSDDVNIKHKSASCSKEDIHDHAKSHHHIKESTKKQKDTTIPQQNSILRSALI